MPVKCGSRRGKKIEWIVCHYPAWPGKDASGLRDYYITCERAVSAHYAVSEERTVEIVDCSMAAWHCATSGKKTFCGATNYNAIGVDLCDRKLHICGKLKAEDCDWYIPEATLSRAAQLIAELMMDYGIDIEHVVRHYDVTHKLCPRPLVGDDTNEYYGISGNERWAQFKRQILEARATAMCIHTQKER